MSKSILKLSKAKALADDLVKQLSPFCQRIEIAGSIRREKNIVGDIELVAIPKTITHAGQLDLFGGQVPGKTVSRLDEELERRVALGQWHNQVPFVLRKTARPAWGDKYKKFWFTHDGDWIQVDLFITRPEQWGALLCIRTGPSDFSQALVTHLRFHTPYSQAEGYLKRTDTGEPVPVPEEHDYFEKAQVAYLIPRNRTVSALRQAIAIWARQHKSAAPATRRNPTPSGGQMYTMDDTDVRNLIRARLEARAGI